MVVKEREKIVTCVTFVANKVAHFFSAIYQSMFECRKIDRRIPLHSQISATGRTKCRRNKIKKIAEQILIGRMIEGKKFPMLSRIRYFGGV